MVIVKSEEEFINAMSKAEGKIAYVSYHVQLCCSCCPLKCYLRWIFPVDLLLHCRLVWTMYVVVVFLVM